MNENDILDQGLADFNQCLNKIISHLSTSELDTDIRSLVAKAFSLSKSMLWSELSEITLYKLLFVSDLCINKFDKYVLSDGFKNTVLDLRYDVMIRLAKLAIENITKTTEEKE